jgi:pantoate--beta-alanine ligase
MYPGTCDVSVVPVSIADRWEGAVRPGHFAGVLTVVAKLFNLVQPDVAVFGQKDLQQATLIRALVRDLDFPITLDIAPIVRESDGLAMSSRNRYLNPAERTTARVLSRSLAAMQVAFALGERDAVKLERVARAVFATGTGASVDYLSVVDADRLEQREGAQVGDFAILAARVGATRLLDNHRLGDPFPVLP